MMIKFFKKLQLILKHLTAGMKNVGLESLQIYTRYRFDSISFLAQDSEQAHAAKKRIQQRQRDIATFETIKTTLTEELGQEKAVSTRILQSLLDLVEFLVAY